MAKKAAQNRATRQQIHKIWRRLGFQNWQELLQTHKRAHNFAPAGEGLLKGLCLNPEHADTVPSFYLNVEKGFAKCYGCGLYESNPLRILSWILETIESDVVQQLQDKYNVNYLPKRVIAELEQHRIMQLVKEEIYQATHQLMCAGIADINNTEFAFAKKGIEWLTVERKIPIETLHLLPVGVMPELTRLQGYIFDRYQVKKASHLANPTTEKEPEDLSIYVFDYLREYIRGPKYIGGIVFPLHANTKEIGRLKIREIGTKDFAIPEDPFEDMFGLFGLGWEQYKSFMSQQNKTDYVYAVEGEIDALSMMAQFMVNPGSAKYPVISVGGKGGATYLETILTLSGIDTCYMVGDAPAAQGDEVVQEWLANTNEVHAKVFIGWDKLAGAEDPDEAVNLLGEPALSDVIFRDASDNFVSSGAWAYMRADEAMAAASKTDLRSLTEIAANHGLYLNNRLECEQYAVAIAQAYGLNADILKREIATRENTEDGFIRRCADALRSFMYVVGTESRNNNRCLVLYDKIHKRFNSVKLDSPQSISQELAPIVGTVYDFVQDRVGYPTFLELPDELVRERVVHKLCFYLKEAIQSLAQGAADIGTATKLKQGYHRIRLPSGEYKEYIVCGPDIIRIDRYENNIQYVMLDGPSDAGIIFDVGMNGPIHSPWYPGGMKVNALLDNQKTDLRRLYDDLVHIYDTGMKYKHHDVTVRLLAGLIMVFPIMAAFERPVLMFITGDTNSGKSNLLSTFSGFGYKNLQLLYAGNGSDDFTSASIASMADRSSLAVCLDEFESNDPAKRDRTRQIFEMFRSLISGETIRTRGRPDGSHYETRFFCPVIYAAIQGAERPQDLNRMLLIHTQKIEFKEDPQSSIYREIGEETIERVRKGLNLGMYPHVLELVQLEKEMRKNFHIIQTELPFQIVWRLASSLFSVLALMKYIGVDWKQFLIDYVKQNEDIISRAASVSESETYLNAMFYHATLQQHDLPPISIAQLLVSPEKRPEINASSCGVYFDESSKLILLLLDQAVPKLLPSHLKYPGLASSRVKEMIDRHSAALSPSEITASGILRKVGPFLGAGIRVQDVTVLHADSWLMSAKSAMDDVADAGSKEPDVEKEEPADELGGTGIYS